MSKSLKFWIAYIVFGFFDALQIGFVIWLCQNAKFDATLTLFLVAFVVSTRASYEKAKAVSEK